MSLAPGARVGVYEIVGPLGAGGMGEVFRARDTTLGRDVALKILPPAFADDAERLARFEREARTLASLNHPNIAQVYGLVDGALVMELVEGEDLSDKIKSGTGNRGPGTGLPLDEALPIARQIAEALEAAHEAGIVHRDLKPANVKVRADGTVKVLDFGLAKAIEPGTGNGEPGTGENSPTITTPAMTMRGVILGTAAYMAPEQAKGKPVDKRADIWAFGAVLYEMLTGRRAFEGEDVSDTLASVLRAEPDYTKLSTEVPGPLRAIVKRCLTKDVRQRARDIGDIRIQIDELLNGSSVADASAAPRTAESPTRSTPRWPLAVAALALLAAIAAGTIAWSRSTSAPPALAFRGTIDLDVEGQIWSLMGPGAVLSPDGTTLAVVVDRPGKPNQVFVRRLDQDNTSPVVGTEGARNIFFSPDGQSIGFFADGKLKRIPISGGAATTLADAAEDRGGYWAEDDTILFAPTARTTIRRVPAAGGTVEEVTRLAPGDTGHRWPQLLPGGRSILYTLVRATGGTAVVVDPLDGGERRVLQEAAFFGRYVPTGHVVFMRREATLVAAALDLSSLQLTSAPMPVVEGVRYPAGPGSAHIAFSESGAAVYLKGGLRADAAQMIWLDRDGVERPVGSESANYRDPRLSPDGTKVASTKARADNDIWIFDVNRGTDSRLTFESTSEIDPFWTPDGRHVTYSVVSTDAPTAVYWKRADGTGDPQLLVRDEKPVVAFSWHPNGRVLALIRQQPGNTADVVTTEFTGDERTGLKAGPLVPFVATEFSETEPAFSPDGRWLAYQSNESGQYEVYVSGYPGPTGRWQISNAAGLFPTWGADGRTLYYRSPEQQIMMVTYEVKSGAFVASAPRPWAPTHLDDLGMVVRTFDVHPDGQRMLTIRVAADERETGVKVTLLTDFFDELRRRVTAGR